MINVNMTDKAGVTLATAGKYCADNVKVTPSADILRKEEQAKIATPTTSAQDITPDAGKALSKVTVNPITAAIVGNLDASSFAASIVAAIEGKGVTVPDGTLLDGMASLIESIQTGGGGGSGNFATGTFTTTDDITSDVVINHNLNVKPKFIIVLSSEITAYTKASPTVLAFLYLFQCGSISYYHKYQSPGSSKSSYNNGNIADSGSGTAGGWYRVNVDETTFTLKQANISSTYGIGASSSFFWIAYGE